MPEDICKVALDFKASGHQPGVYPIISVGACVITREAWNYKQAAVRDLTFYTEIRPASLLYDPRNYAEVLRVDASQLVHLEKIKLRDPRFDTDNPDMFNPTLVLKHLQVYCEDREQAAERFCAWIERIRKGAKRVEGLTYTNTIFFDKRNFSLLFGLTSEVPSLFDSGIDIESFHRLYTGRSDAKLKELDIIDDREKPHRADHDAAFLAKIARILIFEKIG